MHQFCGSCLTDSCRLFMQSQAWLARVTWHTKTASPSSTVMLPVTGGGRLWPHSYVTEEFLCTNASYGVKKSHRGWQLNNLFGVIALLQFSAGKWSAQPLRQPQLRSGHETRDTVRTCGRVTMHSIELTIMSKNVTKLWLRFHVSFYRIPKYVLLVKRQTFCKHKFLLKSSWIAMVSSHEAKNVSANTWAQSGLA